MNNLEVAIKHFEERHIAPDLKGRVSTSEVLEVLRFLKQCEAQEMSLIAIGYTTYVGDKKYAELELNQMYEGGFAVSSKELLTTPSPKEI